MGWTLGHSQEKKCNSPDTSSVRNKMPGHPARPLLPPACPSDPLGARLAAICGTISGAAMGTRVHIERSLCLAG